MQRVFFDEAVPPSYAAPSLLPQECGGAVFELAAGDAELVEEF